jgi:hypothetical protein
MQANPRNLDSLFNSQLRYVVPMFQRLYVWQQTPQWTTLWEDVVEKANLQLAGMKTNAHYLGALIIEGVRPNSPREVKRFLVIDGQQRITTLQLLICAFRDIARHREWKTLDRSTTRYLENADQDVMEKPDEELLKLWPTTLNRDIFKKVVTAGSRDVVEATFPLVRLPRKRYPQPRSNLVEAYLYFSTVIAKWVHESATASGKTEEETAFSLLQALQQDFCVVEIALAEGDDSQEIFYSLNSQGRPLSQSDLLRSLIFMRAEKEKVDRDALFAEYWGRFETPFWSTEIRRGGRSYSRLDLALRFFLMAKTGALVDARRVNEEYRRWIPTQSKRYPTVREELSDFARYGERYERYEGASSSGLPSADLRRVILDFDISTALPLILYLELDAALDPYQLDECLKTVESFIVRRAFTGEETKEYNKFFVEMIGSLRHLSGAAVPQALAHKLTSGVGTTRVWPSDSKVIEAAISRRVGAEMRTPALRLILERLEIASRTKKSESTDIPTGLQIEHVLPQQWSTHWPLKGTTVPAVVVDFPHMATGDLVEFADSIRDRNASLQTVGNLTLLNQYANPAASNGPFSIKVNEYKNSVLRLNRYFDQISEWDEERIKRRGRELGELMCRTWPRSMASVSRADEASAGSAM